MNNQEFLNIIKSSFITFLNTHSGSNAKLKVLHGAIAKDLSEKLSNDYSVKSLGFDNDKEGRIQGRYINKNIDITIYKNNEPITGIGVKFIMQNYAQNSNNYFENMLGETANIRSRSVPYFQIFIIPETLPYYKNGGNIEKWETFNLHHIEKYRVLSNDNDEVFVHVPSKTLIYVVDLPITSINITNKTDYKNYFLGLQNFSINISNTDYGNFGNNLIFNDYESFIDKVIHRILSI